MIFVGSISEEELKDELDELEELEELLEEEDELEDVLSEEEESGPSPPPPPPEQPPSVPATDVASTTVPVSFRNLRRFISFDIVSTPNFKILHGASVRLPLCSRM